VGNVLHECSCQQFELYAAEATISGGRTFASEKELQEYVDELRESDYWQRNFDKVQRIDAFAHPPSWRSGSVGGMRDDVIGQIEMAPVHMCELFVIHEVSHVLAEARYGSHSHDPWFARTYLELAYTALGSETYAVLVAAFDRGGIDHQTDNSNPAGRQV
jgi:putative metallohydrolase (TIGR04338 family)